MPSRAQAAINATPGFCGLNKNKLTRIKPYVDANTMGDIKYSSPRWLAAAIFNPRKTSPMIPIADAECFRFSNKA